MLVLLPLLASVALASRSRLFSTTNDNAQNTLVEFHRDPTVFLGRWPIPEQQGVCTLGQVTALDSQGAVQASADGRQVVHVNAGSNSISVVDIAKDGEMSVRQTLSSMGVFPNSLAVCEEQELVYVLNAGEFQTSVQGYRYRDGALAPLRDASFTFFDIAPTDNTNPNIHRNGDFGQVSFAYDCRRLVVVEKGSRPFSVPQVDTPRLHVLSLDSRGRIIANTLRTTDAAPMTVPFALANGPQNTFFVTNFMLGASSITQYQLDPRTNRFFTRSNTPSTQDGTSFICQSGNVLVTSNFGADTLSTWRVGTVNGLVEVALLKGQAAVLQNPQDVWCSEDGQVSVLNSPEGAVTDSVCTYNINFAHGSLTTVSCDSGVSNNDCSAGLAGR